MSKLFICAILSLGFCLNAELLPAQRWGTPNVYSVPASPTTLGQQVRLIVRPADSTIMYRYVAAMSVTGSGLAVSGSACATPQSIGTGPVILWTPASGAYRITVYAKRKLAPPDSATVTHQIEAPNGGFLNVSVQQNPTPQPPGKLMLSLRTNDRGSGINYQWVVRFVTTPGTPVHPPVSWSGETPYQATTVPMVVAPGTYNITARVGIYTGDRCRISETSVGALTTQVIH
jgi:hypothetical protein